MLHKRLAPGSSRSLLLKHYLLTRPAPLVSHPRFSMALNQLNPFTDGSECVWLHLSSAFLTVTPLIQVQGAPPEGLSYTERHPQTNP